MSPIEPPDSFALAACEGWLELGNPDEAAAEWARLSLPARRHPAALELHWHLLAHRQQWDEAVEVGDQLIACSPEDVDGWLHRAYAIRRSRTGGLQAAYDALHPASALFPENETVAYNLACYTNMLGRPDDGWEWLLRAVQLSKSPGRIKAMALLDPDLESLRPRITGLR